MRSFEIPAMRGCMLTQDTPTHRALFGEEGEAVRYFGSVDEMVIKAREMVNATAEREILAGEAHRRIVQGGHTYSDRLTEMLALSLEA
jgi:spore maturation protein CgeB